MGIDYRHPRRHSPAPGSPSAPPSAPNPGWSQTESIRTEWPKNSLDAVADLRNYQQALALYDRDDYPAMMQCATWFATALAHSLHGDGVTDTGNRMLLSAAIAPPGEPWKGDLRAFFAMPPAPPLADGRRRPGSAVQLGRPSRPGK